MTEIRLGGAIPRMELVPSTERVDQRLYPYDLMVVFVTGNPNTSTLECTRIDFVGFGGSLVKDPEARSSEIDGRFSGTREAPSVLQRKDDTDFLSFIAGDQSSIHFPSSANQDHADVLEHYSMWCLDALRIEVAALAAFVRHFRHEGSEDELLATARLLGPPGNNDRWQGDDLSKPVHSRPPIPLLLSDVVQWAAHIPGAGEMSAADLGEVTVLGAAIESTLGELAAEVAELRVSETPVRPLEFRVSGASAATTSASGSIDVTWDVVDSGVDAQLQIVSFGPDGYVTVHSCSSKEFDRFVDSMDWIAGELAGLLRVAKSRETPTLDSLDDVLPTKRGES